MKIFKELKKLGYKHYTEHTVEELDDLPLNSEERIMEQALVLRWFREKYNLDCSVMLHVARYGITKGIYFEEKSYKYQIRRSFKNPFWIEFDSFKTYEEAELACLRKLIEIVKQK